MPATPVTELTYVVLLDNGEPDPSARVQAVLNHFDVDPDFGYIEPKTIVSTSNPQGAGSLFLWSNERGSTSSWYDVTVDGSERSFTVQAIIPLLGPIKLELASTLPPYPPQSSILQAVADSAANAGAAASSAAEAKTARDEAVAAQAGVAADAATATAAAAQATAAAETAAADAVAAVQGQLDGSVQAATDAATAAALSETNAKASETASADSAVAAKASETASADSAVAAKASEDAAKASETAAADNSTAGADSAVAAKASETAAAASATTALAAQAAADQSAAEAQSSSAQAGESMDASEGFANTALDYLGQMSMALAIMLGYMNDATGAVSLAQAYAAQAASVVQQDLSGVVNAPLYRSPNPVLGTVTYDTTRDKDGGAWVDAVADKSWMNEPLNGAYLAMTSPDGFLSETDARARAATLGAEVNPDPNFANAAGWVVEAGTTVAGGKLTMNAVANGTGAQRADPVGGAMALQPFQVTIVIDSLTVGAVSFRLGTVGGQVRLLSTPGTYTFTVLPAAAGSVMRLTGSGTTTTAVISRFSIKPVTAYVTASGSYYPLATDGKFYKLNKNLAPWSENAFANWSKTGAVTIVTSAGTINGIAAESLSTAATGVGVFRSNIVSQSLGVGELYSAQVLLKHVSGDSTTRVRLEGTAFASPVGVTVNPVDGTWVAAAGTAPTNVSVTPTADGGWALSFSGTTQSAGAVNMSIYSQNVAARTVLATAAQLERGPATSYEPKLTGDLGITETTRGNKQKAPKIAQIVWEAANFTMFDLEEPGRPMWMRFNIVPVSAGAATSGAITASVAGSITSIVAVGGKLFVGRSGDTSNVHGVNEIDFIRDSTNWYAKYTGAGFGQLVGGGTGCRIRGTIADRNVLKPTQPDAAFTLGSGGGVNAIAVTVLPNAPVDPVSGLQIPTVGMALGSGNAGVVGSVVMNDGSIVTYSHAGNDGSTVAFTQRGEVAWGGVTTSVQSVWPLQTANVNNALSAGAGARFYNVAGTSGLPALTLIGLSRRITPAGPLLLSYTTSTIAPGLPGISIQRENPTTQAAGLLANVTGAFNTGYTVGDTRRTVFADVGAGVVNGNEVNPNPGGPFAATTGYVGNLSGALSLNAGALRVTNGAATNGRATIQLALVPYSTYELSVTGAAGSANQPVFGLSNQVDGTVPYITLGITGAGVLKFQAAQATTYLSMYTNNSLTGATSDVASLSVKLVVADRSYKARNAAFVGALTKTLVAAAAQLVSWGGFRNDTSLNPVELVTNGTFDTNLNGWTATNPDPQNPTVIWDSFSNAAAVGGGPGGTTSYLSQAIPTVAGRVYVLTCDIIGQSLFASAGTALNGADVAGPIRMDNGVGRIMPFTAAGAATWISFSKSTGGSGSVDNVSIREAPITVELINNGNFAVDLAGWNQTINGTSSIVYGGGTANITGDGVNAAMFSQKIATVPGRAYRLQFDVGTASLAFAVGTAQNGTQILPFAATGPAVGITAPFTATGTTTWVTFSKTAAVTGTLDNVSVKATNSVGGSMVAAQEAPSADLDFGTAAWRASAWVNLANTAFGPGNFIPRSAWTGAVNGVIGSGGAVPTGMILAGLPAGVSATVTKSTDAASGFEVFDLQLSGNAAAAGNVYLYLSGTAANIASALGQTWTGSVYARLQAGDLTNVSGVNLNIEETNGSTYLTGNAVPLNIGTSAITAQRTTVSRTTNNATINAIRTNVQFVIPAAGAVNITVRLAVPQLERGPVAGTPIATTGTIYNGIAPIFQRAGAAGASYTFGVDATGMLAAEAFDTVTTRRVTSSVPINTGVWNRAAVEYDGAGTLALRINAIPVGSATGTALLTLSNAGASLTYGNNYAMSAAFPGQLALVNIGVTTMSLTAEQWTYEVERQMFKAGAQVTLPDTNPVLATPYDDREGKFKVVTSANEASFNGLVRTAVATGTYGGGSQQSGIKALITTTNRGVDITMGAQNLKEDLLRRTEEANRAAHVVPRPFDFDATANQTDFVLPVGWEAATVIAARNVQREGTGKDYVRKFDGFRETISFAAPGLAAATWVEINARRG